MKVNVYIDGFNLYYGALKDTPFRWLNLDAFCRVLLPHDQINRIRYFTSRVSEHPNDPDAAKRQRTYLRALRTLPLVSVHFGFFLTNPKRRPLAPPSPPNLVTVIEEREKGSDVNLATYLLLDAFQGEYEAAVLVTNDLDLLEPVRVVREVFKKTVGAINPQKIRSKKLQESVDFYRPVRQSALARSQFPSVMQDVNGTFHKPSEW